MPARLPESPPPVVSRPSLPMATAMSLAEMARPIPESHRLLPPLSSMSETSHQMNLHQAVFNTSRLALPPLGTRQPDSSSYMAFPHDPNLALRASHYSPEYPATVPSRNVHHSYQSPRFSPLRSAPPNATARSGRETVAEASPRKIYQTQHKDENLASPEQQFPHLNANLPPSPTVSFKRERPSLTLGSRSPEALQQLSPSIQWVKGDNQGLAGSSQPICKDSPSLQYDIVIRQQPVAARACGFGERDRRVIDPPPILQMVVRDPNATPAELDSKLRYPNFVVHCELWNADTDTEETAIPEIGERRQQRRLMGTLVSSPFVGRDEHEVEGCFFPFPDLSCRTVGRYRLKFVLVVLNPASMKPGDRLPFKATVLSTAFNVYTAKTFPGMIESTALTKRLKDQGCLISVKKGHHRADRLKEARSREEDDQEDDEDSVDIQAGGSENGREKRQKK